MLVKTSKHGLIKNLFIWFIDCLEDISPTVPLICAILSPLQNLPVYKWGHFLFGDPSLFFLYLWLSNYRVLITNLKERLVLSVGIPLLSIEPQCEGYLLVICDLINLVRWYLDVSKSYDINKNYTTITLFFFAYGLQLDVAQNI